MLTDLKLLQHMGLPDSLEKVQDNVPAYVLRIDGSTHDFSHLLSTTHLQICVGIKFFPILYAGIP